MHKLAILLVFVCLAAAGGALFLAGGDEPDSELEVAIEEQGAMPGALALSGPEEALDDQASESTPEGLQDMFREEAVVTTAVATRKLVVQVWNRRTGVPAVGAGVFFLEGGAVPRPRDPLAQHWSDLAVDRGRRFETDARGRVELPAVAARAIVTAVTSDAYGFLLVGRRHRDVETITLQPDETVTIRVVDRKDHGVSGVPVGVVQRLPVRDPTSATERALYVMMKDLEAYARRAESSMRADPRQREAAANRIRAIRMRQAELKARLMKQQKRRKLDAGRKGAPAPKITSLLDVRARRRTNEHGIAQFRHFQIYRRQQEKWWPPETVDRFEAVLLMPLQQPVGKPIAGAIVQLQRERELGGKQPRLGFADEAFASARSDDGGKYELFADLEPARYRLRVRARNHFPFISPDLRPGQPADFRLLRRSKLVGTVLAPKWLPTHMIRVELASAVEPKKRREDRVHDYRGKKYIHFDWVQPGTYRLRIRMRDFPDPIVRIDGLVVAPGQTGVHPRLMDLDLAAYVHRFEITAVDERDQPIKPNAPLIAKVIRPGGRTAYVGFPWRGARVEIMSVSPTLEVWPMAAGYHAEPALLSQGQSRLRFLTIPPVLIDAASVREVIGTTPAWLQLSWIAGAPGANGPNQLETWDGRSRKIAGWYRSVRSRNWTALRASGMTPIRVTGNGRHRVVLAVGDKRKGIRPVSISLGEVDVSLAPGRGPQRIRPEVEREKLVTIMAQLRQRAAAAQQNRR